MKVCYVVHTPFQLLFATIIMKRINAYSTLISIEDGPKNQMNSLHPFIQDNWERYHFLNITGLGIRMKDYSIEKKNEIFALVNNCDIICLWSLHIGVNQIIMDHYKGLSKIYVFPEGIGIVEYFRKSIKMFIRRIKGHLKYYFNFDYIFTYFAYDLIKYSKIREMPFLFTEANIKLLKLPNTDFEDFSDYEIIFYSQPLAEIKNLSEEMELAFVERVLKPFSDKKILVFLHPRETHNKYINFKNVKVVPSYHLPNEIFIQKCKPKLVIALVSSMMIHSAIMFPDVPHVLLYKLIKLRRTKNRIKSFDRIFGSYPNIFILNNLDELQTVSRKSIRGKMPLPTISEQQFFENYFSID